MRKALIAHSSEELANALSQMLCSLFDVTTCADGLTALELLKTLQPQILILDLMLPLKDGLSLLADAAPVQPEIILGIISERNNHILCSAQEHGIGGLFLDPCDTCAVVDRLMSLLEADNQPHAQQSRLESEAANLLLKFGLKPGLDGFHQLQAGIPIYMQNSGQRLSKELYPAIAQLCGNDSGLQVEHSIRTAIHCAWNNRDISLWNEYFPGWKKAPTNRVFLSRMAAALKVRFTE